MTILLNLFFALIFLSWFILTIINQFNYKWVQKVKKFDVFHLLPRWTFFAPNPGTSDYHFVFRLMDVNNNVSSFTEIPLYGNRNFLSAFWNSNKRVKKALADLVMDLNRQCVSKEINEENIKISFSYIALLNFLSNVPKSTNTKSIQFAILKSQGFIDDEIPSLIICSEFHNV